VPTAHIENITEARVPSTDFIGLPGIPELLHRLFGGTTRSVNEVVFKQLLSQSVR
jgi:hypothetical protein